MLRRLLSVRHDWCHGQTETDNCQCRPRDHLSDKHGFLAIRPSLAAVSTLAICGLSGGGRTATVFEYPISRQILQHISYDRPGYHGAIRINGVIGTTAVNCAIWQRYSPRRTSRVEEHVNSARVRYRSRRKGLRIIGTADRRQCQCDSGCKPKPSDKSHWPPPTPARRRSAATKAGRFKRAPLLSPRPDAARRPGQNLGDL